MFETTIRSFGFLPFGIYFLRFSNAPLCKAAGRLSASYYDKNRKTVRRRVNYDMKQFNRSSESALIGTARKTSFIN